MERRFALSCAAFAAVVVILILSFSGTAHAQQANTARALITEKVSDANLVTLAGNTRPEAIAANDRGPLAPDAPMEHMLLQLKRSPEQEQSLSKFVDELQTAGSPNYHNWITAQEFGQRFGLAPQDLATIRSWLEMHGFTVNVVYPSGTMIDFSGNAGQVRQAFGTEIHNLDVNGVKHFANFGDPKIPAALAPAVVGIVSLHDFLPHAMHKMRPQYTFTNSEGEFLAVVPADLATIYNLNPLFTNGISGQGQTVVVIEDTNVNSPADWTTFRSTFGLSSFTSGSFSQVHPAPPTGTNNCTNPGTNGDDGEAILDAEYASAAAPSAAIELASCSDTSSFGGLIALQNLLNESATPPAVVSISYGECEAANGAASNAAFSSVYSQAVTEGVSVFVSAGDEGAASCDANEASATHGISVSGFASTPFNVAVGGTDFGDTFAGTNSTYWNTTNTTAFGSAKSYIPEIPWNDSCASALLSTAEGFSTPYGSTGFCNSTLGEEDFLTTGSGSGGPSGCASGMPATAGVVSGTCAGWPKPSWQTLVGVPSDGVRDMPDVSLFSANGVWGHFFIFCNSDTRSGGGPCTGAPSGWAAAGGTSFASPIIAGFQALINQKTGSRQGNPNPTYYSLAAGEYGPGGDASCNSTLGNGVSSTCIFYDVKQGDMDVNCTGTHNCFKPSGTNGVLSTSNTAYDPAYGTTTGWDFATGIGTINVANLVNAWPGASTPNFTLSASPSSVTIIQGGAGGTSTISVAPTNSFSGSVTFSASGLPTGVTAAFSPNPSTSSTTLTLTASSTAATGTAIVTITGVSGSLSHSTSVSLTVNGTPNFTLAAAPTSVTITQGAAGGTSTLTITRQNGFSAGVTLAASGLPTGVTAAFSTNPATTTSTLTLTASATATVGAATVTITGTSGSLTHSATVSLTVNASPNFSLAASPTSVAISQGAAGTSTVTITRLNGFTSSVTLSASGLPSGVTAAFSPNPGTTTSKLTLTASATATTGPATVTITGTSGSLTHTTTVSLTVNGAPNFALSASPTSVSITRGGSGTSAVTITPQNGFSGSVTLAASGLPRGVTATFSPNPGTSSSTLTLKTSAFATAGTSTITITGTSGTLSHTTTISVTVTTTATANFSMAASPASVTITKGGAGGTSTVTITRLNGFTSNVTLSASGLPSGVTAAFSPNPATSTSALTLTASSTATTGTSTVTITGTSGTLVHTATVSLTVNAASSPNFTLTASPASVSVATGSHGATTVTVHPTDGFTGSVTLSATGMGAGTTAAFGTNPATGTSTLTFTASSSAITGSSTVTITGTSGTLTQTTSITVVVRTGLGGLL
jgi:subtilase family serine protease